MASPFTTIEKTGKALDIGNHVKKCTGCGDKVFPKADGSWTCSWCLAKSTDKKLITVDVSNN